MPELRELVRKSSTEVQIDVENAFYFLSHIEIAPVRGPGMRMWRKRLFAAMSRNAASPTDDFRLPGERTLIMGSRIELWCEASSWSAKFRRPPSMSASAV